MVSIARRTRRRWVLAAAAAIIALAAGAFVIARSSGSDATVIARAPLDPLVEGGRGAAELLDDAGELRLRVEFSGLADIVGYYELWLLNEDVSGLISLGPLRADGVYQLPSGIDPSAFPIVDVAIEAFDGVPSHSSESVLRGQLNVVDRVGRGFVKGFVGPRWLGPRVVRGGVGGSRPTGGRVWESQADHANLCSSAVSWPCVRRDGEGGHQLGSSTGLPDRGRWRFSPRCEVDRHAAPVGGLPALLVARQMASRLVV